MNIQRLIKNTTPFIILSILALLVLVYFLLIERGSSEAMAGLFIVFPLTAIGVMLAVDFSLKRMLKTKPGWIWLIEIILMLACIYWWIIT
jgi:hypothetical protein